MKTTLTLGLALLLWNIPHACAQRLTTDDPNYGPLYKLAEGIGWYQNSQTKTWMVADSVVDNKGSAVCMEALDNLRTAGVADTRTIEIQWEGPEFKQGAHTLAEIRGSCEHVQRLGKIKSFEFWAVLAMQDAPKVASGRSDPSYFKRCIETYNRIVKAGIAPTELVPERMIGSTAWSGTIEELRQKWCDTGLTKANGNAAEREAPYRKELKADKLKIALTYGSFFLPGGASTGDAHKLAEAPVWFIDLSPSKVCPNGRQVHTVRRYQFGPAHQLLKSTEQEFCGAAPRSAFQ
jgi:hypothetical protein